MTFQGAPLAGVMVTAYSTNNNVVVGTTTTDAGGAYTFSGLEATADVTANFQFWPTLPGYAFDPSVGTNAVAARASYLWNPVPQNWYLPLGLSTTRAGYNGAYASADGSSGALFNVVNFMSALTGTVNGSVTGANFVAYNGSNPLATVPATGQHTSYAAGDDAALQTGVAWPATRFVDNADGTVTDNLTGLVWLKNAGCFTPAIWATAIQDANQLASGSCGLTDGSAAGDWRLPNLIELNSLVDVSASNPAVLAGSPFANVSSGIYWSSTAYYGGQEGTTNAWVIRFADGSYINDGSSNLMTTSTNAVWAVKGTGGGAARLQATGAYVQFVSGDDGSLEFGAALPTPRIIDNGNGTVTDSVTGLIWMKQANCINQPWAAAIAAIQTLASGQCGLTDGSSAGEWRMPNRNELQSLADRAQNNQADRFGETFTSTTPGLATQSAIFTSFIPLQYYWSSTTDAANPNEAWTVFSCDFGVYANPKSASGYSLAVRGP